MIKLVKEVEAEEQAKKEQILKNKSKLQSKDFPLPLYQSEIYPHLYREEKWFKLFSKKWVNNLISLFSRDKIIDSFIGDIYPGSKVLQMGVSFGDEIERVADQIGYQGRFDIIDVNNAQISFKQAFLSDMYPQVNFFHYNAEDPLPEKYDTVICYMLLHELPIVSKMKVVNNALNSINENGKVIFVDYGRPGMLHPLAYIVRMFNRLYQPFAEKLWDKEIASFAEHDLDYNWKKTKFLGGMYQRVTVTNKDKDQLFY